MYPLEVITSFWYPNIIYLCFLFEDIRIRNVYTWIHSSETQSYRSYALTLCSAWLLTTIRRCVAYHILVCPPKVKVSNFSWGPQGLAVIFSHHQVCIKKKKGGHFVFRADGQSDHYGAFATMWGALIICYMVFFNINVPFGSDYFVLISQHNLSVFSLNFSWGPQGLAVIFSHHQVCIKKKKGGHFLGGQKWK
jgi:hypothetical protein